MNDDYDDFDENEEEFDDEECEETSLSSEERRELAQDFLTGLSDYEFNCTLYCSGGGGDSTSTESTIEISGSDILAMLGESYKELAGCTDEYPDFDEELQDLAREECCPEDFYDADFTEPEPLREIAQRLANVDSEQEALSIIDSIQGGDYQVKVDYPPYFYDVMADVELTADQARAVVRDCIEEYPEVVVRCFESYDDIDCDDSNQILEESIELSDLLDEAFSFSGSIDGIDDYVSGIESIVDDILGGDICSLDDAYDRESEL